MDLPTGLRDTLRAFPHDVVDPWIAALPERIGAAEQRWGIAIGRPFQPGGVTSFVAPATMPDGTGAVYKITVPHDDALGEAAALDAYAGDGAVRILAAEPPTFELLLERATPGHDLWSVTDDAVRLDVACTIARRLSRPGASDRIRTVRDVAGRWADLTERRLIHHELPWIPDPIELGIDLLRRLPHEAHERLLVHGDFHPGNILAAEREPWLAIDPKPLVGDPAFEPVQLLTQRGGRIAEPPAPPRVEQRLGAIASGVDLDAERIGRWAIARTAEWSMWSWDHGDTIDAAIAYTWARTLATVLA